MTHSLKRTAEEPIERNSYLFVLPSPLSFDPPKERLSKFAPESPLGSDILSMMMQGVDLAYSCRQPAMVDEITRLYMFHSLLSVMTVFFRYLLLGQACDQVKADNERLKENSDLSFRDQGFTRPRVLILLPFRSSAERCIHSLKSLMPASFRMENLKRFDEEYGPQDEESEEKSDRHQAEWERVFARNNDDCFHIGMAYNKKEIKLYTPFYKSDIIVASPLGLRLVTGLEGEAKGDYDFLSSLELCVIDQGDVIKVQNWSHLKDVLNLLNLIPKQDHETDFSRVSEHLLEGKGRNFRQTLYIGEHHGVEVNQLFAQYTSNAKGIAKVRREYKGSLNDVLIKTKQLFQFLPCDSPGDQPDARFKYFSEKVFPQIKQPEISHYLIYIPSYFDYVRIRNHLKANLLDGFDAVSEYSSPPEVSRARTKFFKGDIRILVYSGRLHFFRRYRIRGVHTLLFYGPPDHEDLYTGMVDGLQSSEVLSVSSVLLYTKFDRFQIERIVGTSRFPTLIGGAETTYMFL